MFSLQTARLYLVPTPLAVVQKRLETDHFTAEITLPHDYVSVTFSPEWPGDAIVFFPDWAKKSDDELQKEWGGTIITRDTKVAIGEIGCKGAISDDGTIEIGYGLNPSAWGQGYMTEMVTAFSEWLLIQPEVKCVMADCLKTNRASVRVLEKSGFVKVSERFDKEEGGVLFCWEKK